MLVARYLLINVVFTNVMNKITCILNKSNIYINRNTYLIRRCYNVHVAILDMQIPDPVQSPIWDHFIVLDEQRSM